MSAPGTTRDPLVTVIVPAYNSDKFLGAAIESVLGQTYPTLEIVVVDDGSTDRTADVARSYAARVRYVWQERSGPAAAKNRGVRESRGALLGFLDADDVWLPHKLARQVDVLTRDPSLDAVFGHAEQFDDTAAAGSGTRRAVGPRMPGYTHCTMLIRRERLLGIGSFDIRYRVGEFIDWYARAKAADLTALMLPDIVIRRRIHGGNHGIVHRGDAVDYVRILKAALDRRRESASGASPRAGDA